MKFYLFYNGDTKNFAHSFIIPQEFAFLFEFINGGPFRPLICSKLFRCRELLAVGGDFVYSPKSIVGWIPLSVCQRLHLVLLVGTKKRQREGTLHVTPRQVGRAGRNLGGFERRLLTLVSWHFAFFTTDGKSAVHQSQNFINSYESGA